jgi:hypothetical protein
MHGMANDLPKQPQQAVLPRVDIHLGMMSSLMMVVVMVENITTVDT